MTQPVPDPVLDFFTRYLANPAHKGLCDFCFNLLGLEFTRATRYMMRDPPPEFAMTDAHRADVALAEHMLARAADDLRSKNAWPDLASNWLRLLGHRVSTERDLAGSDPIGFLGVVAGIRLGLPDGETDAWSDEMLFRHYTETSLRDEWDYAGIGFRDLDTLRRLRVWPFDFL